MGVYVVTGESAYSSVAKCYTESLLATVLLLTWSMSILVENCKMDGCQI